MAPPLYIRQVMESMGWTDGSYIPIANEENRKLLENINELMKDKNEYTNSLQTLDKRLQKLIEHKKNAEHDIRENLNLIAAYRSQYATETNMLLLAEREESKLKNEIKDNIKEYEDRKQYEKNTENDIERTSKNIDKLLNKINWAKTCLIEWRQAIVKGEETNTLIEKYCKEDESKAKSLDNKRRILQDTINKQKSKLIESYDEQRTLEQILDRTAQFYRQIHFEKRQLVSTWKDAVLQMNQRENNIIKIEKDLDNAIKLTALKDNELKEQNEFMKQQILNNKEIEIEINDLNHEVSLLRQKLQDHVDEVYLKENELNALKKSFQTLAKELQNQRQYSRQMMKEKLQKEKEIEEFEKQYEILKERYEKFRTLNLNAQERIHQFDDMIENEEKIKQELSKDITRLNNLHYRTQSQINTMKDTEKRLITDNQGIENVIQILKNHIKEAEKELPRLTLISYDLNLKINQLRKRLAKVKGTTPESDESEKQERLIKLRNDYEAYMKEFNQLQSKIIKNEEDLKIISKSLNEDNKELEKMNSKFKEAELYSEGTVKQLKEQISYNHERIVELSVLKMRVHELEKQIEKHENKVYTLEKHRIELENAIKKRLTDIQSQKQLLFIKKKNLLDEKSTLKADLGERHIKIDALKKRYELATELLGKNDDGTLITATQIKISNAQEKQLLLQEGNELNSKVIKAEDDIKAMENTLSMMNYSNDLYRKTFEKVDEDNPEVQELNNLQENYTKAIVRLRNLKTCIANMTQNIEESIQKRDAIEMELEEAYQARMERNEQLKKIHKELMEQSVKISRAERELKVSHKKARQRCLDPDYLIKYEKDLDIRELTEKNKSSLQLLSDFIDMNYELGPLITQLLYNKGMRIPQDMKRIRSQQTLSRSRSEYSDLSVSEGSLRIFSASSKVSSVASSVSSKNIKTSGSITSIVSIDFPDKNVSREKHMKK